MTTSSCSIRSLSDPPIAFQGQMSIQSQPNRRKYPREPASFLVNCQQADLTRAGGKALNWSPEGNSYQDQLPNLRRGAANSGVHGAENFQCS